MQQVDFADSEAVLHNVPAARQFCSYVF